VNNRALPESTRVIGRHLPSSTVKIARKFSCGTGRFSERLSLLKVKNARCHAFLVDSDCVLGSSHFIAASPSCATSEEGIPVVLLMVLIDIQTWLAGHRW